MDNAAYDSEEMMRWLDGEMTGEEKTGFEKALSGNPLLLAETERLQLAREAIRSYGLKREVGRIHEEMMREMQPPVKVITSRTRIIRYSLSIAAAILLIVIGITAYNFFTLTTERLYEQQFRSYDLRVVRSGSNLSPVEKLYQEKNYRAVIEATNIVSRNSIEENFLCGLSYLEVNNPGGAIEPLSEVVKRNQASGGAEYNDQAGYYLALAYLKSKNYGKAIELMEAIHNNPNHPYHEKFSSSFIRKVKMLSWR